MAVILDPTGTKKSPTGVEDLPRRFAQIFIRVPFRYLGTSLKGSRFKGTLWTTNGSVKKFFGSAPYNLYVEPDKENIAVANNVVLALDGQPSRVFDLLLASQLDDVVVLNDLGPDKPTGHIGVNLAGRLDD